jgi:uncharacterized protein (DUF885 family)
MGAELKSLALAMTAAGLILAGAPAALAANSADAKFEALYTKEWAWRQAEFGRIDDSEGEGARNNHLPHVDAASQARRLAYWNDVLKALAAIDPKALSPAERVNYEVYRIQVENLAADQRFKTYEEPFNSDSSFWADIAPSSGRSWRAAAEYQAYLGRLHDLPRYFDENIANMRAGIARGYTVPRASIEGRDQSIADIAAETDPETNVFYAPFKSMPASIPADQQAALKAEAAKAIREDVVPAHQKLLAFMRTEYFPHATQILSSEAYPDGKAYYQHMIHEYTTLDLTPDQIHAIGLSEVARIHAEMLAVMAETGFKGTFPEFLTYLRTDPKFYAKTPEELLGYAALIAKRGDAKLSQYFGLLPRGRFTIIPVPANIAPFYTSGRGGAHVYLVNTYDLPHRPLFQLTALTLHEAELGHGLQGEIAEEQPEQPAFRRHSYISAYGEGWALYTEKLGKEMGLYQTPYDDFGRLSWEMWRACRLVVDTGIHHKGWTRQQAIDYLAANTALPLHEIETEVDRYITWPGQALSYKLGEIDIERLRAKSEKALGPKFDIRAFHDTVLSMGSVPLPVLDQRIDEFIASGGVDTVTKLKN